MHDLGVVRQDLDAVDPRILRKHVRQRLIAVIHKAFRGHAVQFRLEHQIGLADQPAVAHHLPQGNRRRVGDFFARRHAGMHPGNQRVPLGVRHFAVIDEIVVSTRRVPRRHRLIADNFGQRRPLFFRLLVGQKRKRGLGPRLMALHAVLPQDRRDVLVVGQARIFRRRSGVRDQAAVDRRLRNGHRLAGQHGFDGIFQVVVLRRSGLADNPVLVVNPAAVLQNKVGSEHNRLGSAGNARVPPPFRRSCPSRSERPDRTRRREPPSRESNRPDSR